MPTRLCATLLALTLLAGCVTVGFGGLSGPRDREGVADFDEGSFNDEIREKLEED